MAQEAAPAERMLTRYLVFASPDQGRTWAYLGDQLSNNSESALREFFGTPPGADADRLYAACSENSFKPRKLVAKVSTGITDVAMPGADLLGEVAQESLV